MKGYEKAVRSFVEPNSHVVIRLDGRAFHTWTKGLARPYDTRLIDVMAEVTETLCKEIGLARVSYHQSDEISIYFTDLAREETQMWFGGGIQKIVSVAASIATGVFARAYPDRSLAQFDARIIVLPDEVEVANYFRWRQADAERNAIGMISHDRFGHKRLTGVGTAERRQMLVDDGFDFEVADPRFLHGQVSFQTTREERVEYVDKRTGETRLSPLVKRRVWETTAAPRLDAALDGWLMSRLAATA